MTSRKIDINAQAIERGYRNFCSFMFAFYYGRRESLQVCASRLGVSRSKIGTSVKARGWPLRSKGQQQGCKLQKRKVDIWVKVKQNTPFLFPWCAICIYYYKYELTTYEVAKQLGISQSFLLTLMKKYKQPRRKQGGDD